MATEVTEPAEQTAQPASCVVLGREAGEIALPAPAQRALTFGLLLSGVRCTVQYVLLPFVLPWIGVAASIPSWLTLGLGAIAVASLTRNVVYLWRRGHARRWSYLSLASVALAALVIFMVIDLQHLVRL